MKILLLSGLGPSWPQGSAFYDSKMLTETFLEKEKFHIGLGRMIKIEDFEIVSAEGSKIEIKITVDETSITKQYKLGKY